MFNEDLVARQIDGWQQMVENAGGIWVGVQRSLTPDVEEYILFASPAARSKLLCLPVSRMAPENVRAALGIPAETPVLSFKDKMKQRVTALRAILNQIEEEIKND